MAYTEIIDQRLRLIDFDKETLDCLKKIQSILEPSIDHVLDRFYIQVNQDPEFMALFPNEQSLATARKGQRDHWMNVLFSGDIGKAHYDNAERIGKTHERIGLSLSKYLGGYCIIINQFLRVISDHYHDDNVGMTKKIHALNKAVFMDIDSVIDSYLDAKDNAIQKVLIQTEQFSSELKEINITLAKQASDHQLYIIDLWNKQESVSQRSLELERQISGIQNKKINSSDESNKKLIALLQESAAVLKTNREINLGMSEVKGQASQLADKINNLNLRHDKLKAHHKCHFTMTEKKSMLEKIKSFLSGI